jgi:hypothetical protein
MDHVENLVKVAKPLRTGVFHDDGMFRLAGKAGIILNLRNALDHNPLGLQCQLFTIRLSEPYQIDAQRVSSNFRVSANCCILSRMAEVIPVTWLSYFSSQESMFRLCRPERASLVVLVVFFFFKKKERETPITAFSVPDTDIADDVIGRSTNTKVAELIL